MTIDLPNLSAMDRLGGTIASKLQPGDVMMFDNHRLLHGRTAYDSNEGMRHLQGCYLEFDATDGKLRHLARKFK